MKKINVLLLCGGGGSEHDVSLISARYFLNQLQKIEFIETYYVEIGKDSIRRDLKGRPCELRKTGELFYPSHQEQSEKTVTLDFAIPCLHGSPGETGEIQSVFELMKLPYLGTRPEGSRLCFNKVTTKLWLNALGIPNTPFIFLYDQSQQAMDKALSFFKEQGDIFVKAAQQGSSIGAFHITSEAGLCPKIAEAFTLSDYVLLEKTIRGRELEVSAYEYDKQVIITQPGEILCSGDFYDYKEKYDQDSQAKTITVAPDLDKPTLEKIKRYAEKAFLGLGIRHLARIDFFLSEKGELFLNEPNTFPGHTPISMFPLMLENNGHQYHQFLSQIIKQEVTNE